MEGENKSDYKAGMLGDIEQNITPTHPSTPDHHQNHHLSTTTGVNEQNNIGHGEVNDNDGDDDDDDEQPQPAASRAYPEANYERYTTTSPPPPPPPPPRPVSAHSKVVKFTILAIGIIVCCPIYVSLMIVLFVCFGSKVMAFKLLQNPTKQGSISSSKKATNQGSVSSAGSIYDKKLYESGTPFKIRGVSTTVASRVGCLFLLWLVISRTLPSLKMATFLGVIHWKWSLLAALLSLGYPCVLLSAYFTAHMLVQNITNPEQNTNYLVWGLLESIASLLHTLFIFLVWMLYYHGRHHLHAGVDYYITRTLAVCLVGAFLWLVKTALVLGWEQKTIYNKFRARILMSGFRLFFLVLILDDKWYPPLLPCRFEVKKKKWRVGHGFQVRSTETSVLQYVSSRHVSLHQMKMIAQYLINLTRMISREDDHQLSRVMRAYQRRITSQFG